MTIEDVKDKLGRLSANRGRAARLTAEIARMEAEAAQLRALEADPLKANAPNGMPRRKGGKSDPTGKKAVQLADGQAMSREEARLRERMQAKKDELSNLQFEIHMAEGWIGALMERERMIITLQTVQKRSWRETAAEYKKAFGDEMSEDTLRRMRDRTIELIAREM
ncbi:MAG: hypothetical protein IKM82_00855 [Oscillospiraceae bacterium]|nr:hypothetical protein [Oscillospiraceae bacterium]MBR4636268.1 hypothetical protein [Clostridia bacterium]MBR6839120.1 hypothetical protein [Oscillospiraceae bacterium]